MVDFIRYRFFFLLFSVLFLLVGLVSIAKNRFVYSIDFVGGGLVEYTATKKTTERVRGYLESQNEKVLFQEIEKGFVVRGTSLTKNNAQTLTETIEKKFDAKQTRFELVSPSVSGDNIQKTILASLVAVVTILIYVGYVFRGWRFALSAVVALLHDVVGLLGIWSIAGLLLGAEFDVLFVTCLLTTMSFSVHDTIVIFDKIKEEERIGAHNSLKDTANAALNLTMMRSINNSLTIVIMLSSLMILGGGAIGFFAMALLAGTLLGTYSSPFIATPIYYELVRRFDKRRAE